MYGTALSLYAAWQRQDGHLYSARDDAERFVLTQAIKTVAYLKEFLVKAAFKISGNLLIFLWNFKFL